MNDPVATVETHPPLPRTFYARHPCKVAPQLLNKLLVRDDGRIGRIVEVEAYAGSEDPAAHSFRGRTARNATMFGPAGHLYVYFSYGMHCCANAVCGPEGDGWGVLLRAVEPLQGLEWMRRLRTAAKRDCDLANGPGKLARAFGIRMEHDGADLVEATRGIWLASDGRPPPACPIIGPRVGIRLAAEIPWRWSVPDHACVSRGRPMARIRS